VNENEVAGRIVARLDQDLAELPASTVQKLQAARRAALAACRPSAPDNRTVLSWLSGHPRTTRWVVPAAVVVASLTGLIYWQVSSHHDEELDTGLLAGELPIHAYTDPGFETWLKHSQYEQSQQ
jgi:uncharacterized protein DUF3619